MSDLLPLPFASGPFERSAHLRKDTKWLTDSFRAKDTKFLIFQDGMIASTHEDRPEIVFSRLTITPDLPAISSWMFLGLPDETPYFAINLAKDVSLSEFGTFEAYEFSDLRPIAIKISNLDAQLAATARSIFAWHDRHGFCSNCGHETTIVEAGWKRQCPSCDAEHFPRTDPVAIMLAIKDGKALLGRGRHFPENLYTCLAGFVEPGETIEQAAARELFEEAGVRAKPNARYLFSQPWPWPSSLMCGICLEVESFELNLDQEEIADAKWFTKEEVRLILAKEHPTYIAPSRIAVARHMMQYWVDQPD